MKTLGNILFAYIITILIVWLLFFVATALAESNVVVAIIDTGIDAEHRDLKDNIWRDSQHVFGWNYVTNKPNPNDEEGHGTHVAGIINAVANPKGLAGKKVLIMSVKYFYDVNHGAANLSNTVKAIYYAVEHGAKIINYSGGGPEFCEEEYIAIKKAESMGVLFVAAAGNERKNVDDIENYYYPASYRLSNIISVAAIGVDENLLKTSNWGKISVEVAAPGENIFSTLPGSRYGYMSGTSQSTAFVSGTAALILSHNPNLTPKEVINIIISSVKKVPQLEKKIKSGGTVNVLNALQYGRSKSQPKR